MLESHIGGPIILTKFFEGMDSYEEMYTKMQDKILEQALSQFVAYLSLENADTKQGQIQINSDRFS